MIINRLSPFVLRAPTIPSTLLALLFVSALPSFFQYSAILTNQSQLPYIFFSILRELILFSYFILSIFLLLRATRSPLSVLSLGSFIVLFFLLASFFLGVTDKFGPILIASAVRFFILASMPLLINIIRPRFTVQHLRINLYILIFYLLLSFLSFIVGYHSFPPIYGATFLGPRFPFIYENPITSSMAFASFICFLSWLVVNRITIVNRVPLILTFVSVLFFFILLTGGRSGLIASAFAIILLFGSLAPFKYTKAFLNPRSLSLKLLTIPFMASVLISLLILSSSQSISGRSQTSDQLSQGSFLDGLYYSRLDILESRLDGPLLDVLIGTPGFGTNTATMLADIPTSQKNSDSFLTSSFTSFGISGLALFLITLYIFVAQTPIFLAMAFLVFSLSQSIPEVILPWTQLCLLLTYSSSPSLSTLTLRLLRTSKHADEA